MTEMDVAPVFQSRQDGVEEEEKRRPADQKRTLSGTISGS